MKPGFVEVIAYQETLLIMAVFGIVILAMIWVGFRRWLRTNEQTNRLLSEQAGQFGAQMERVEARLNAIEQMVSNAGQRATAQIESSVDLPPEPVGRSASLSGK